MCVLWLGTIFASLSFEPRFSIQKFDTDASSMIYLYRHPRILCSSDARVWHTAILWLASRLGVEVHLHGIGDSHVYRTAVRLPLSLLLRSPSHPAPLQTSLSRNRLTLYTTQTLVQQPTDLTAPPHTRISAHLSPYNSSCVHYRYARVVEFLAIQTLTSTLHPFELIVGFNIYNYPASNEPYKWLGWNSPVGSGLGFLWLSSFFCEFLFRFWVVTTPFLLIYD